MMIFYSGDKMVDLVRNNYELLPVIFRFGIKMGYRDLTIHEVCQELHVNEDFFLAIVNTYTNTDYFPKKELRSFSPIDIVRYLQRTHDYYLKSVLPEIEQILLSILEKCDQACDDLKLIELFYRNYKKELLQHIKEEEEVVFPYVINLVDKKVKPLDHPGILAFEKEHSNVEIKLNDLKNLIIKYVNPGYDQYLCMSLLSLLFRFEKDLIDHARIEDKILVPAVRNIEKEERK